MCTFVWSDFRVRAVACKRAPADSTIRYRRSDRTVPDSLRVDFHLRLDSRTLCVPIESTGPAIRPRENGPARTSPDSTCLAPVQALDGWKAIILPDTSGSLRLPPNTRIEPLGTNSQGRHFVLADSAVIDAWVTPEPASGFAAGGLALKASQNCQTVIATYPAAVARVELGSPGRASVFIGMLSVTLDSTRALNMTVRAATASARDDLLKRLGSVELRARRP